LDTRAFRDKRDTAWPVFPAAVMQPWRGAVPDVAAGLTPPDQGRSAITQILAYPLDGAAVWRRIVKAIEALPALDLTGAIN